jgi:hypothetical protein
MRTDNVRSMQVIRMADASKQTTKKVTTGDLLKRSWQLLLDSFPALVVLVAVHGIRNVLIVGLVLFFFVESPASPTIALCAIVALFTMSYLEIPALCLSATRGEPIKLFVIPNVPRTISWLIASVLFGIAVSAGLVFFVIPGIIIAALLSTYGFGIVDGENPIAALYTSYRVVRAAFGQTCIVLVLSLVFGLLIHDPAMAGLDIAVSCALTFALCIVYTNSDRRRAER